MLPWGFKGNKKRDKIGGNENPRESRGLTLKEKRKEGLQKREGNG